jgi:hypothetical protein
LIKRTVALFKEWLVQVRKAGSGFLNDMRKRFKILIFPGENGYTLKYVFDIFVHERRRIMSYGCNKDCRMGEIMKECAGTCKCCSFMCLILGVIGLLLGFFLSPEVVRILWLVASGIVVLLGLMCCCKSCCKPKKDVGEEGD